MLVVAYCNCSGQQYSRSWIDVDYAGDGRVYHKLDIYLPEIVRPSYPAVVVVLLIQSGRHPLHPEGKYLLTTI